MAVYHEEEEEKINIIRGNFLDYISLGKTLFWQHTNRCWEADPEKALWIDEKTTHVKTWRESYKF